MSDTNEGRALLAKSVEAHDSGDWFAESYHRQVLERYLTENAEAMLDALDAVRHALKRLERFDSGERDTLVAPHTETVVVPDFYDHHDTVTRGTQISQPYASALAHVVSNIEDAIRALDGTP
jgi:hypothetical protein